MIHYLMLNKRKKGDKSMTICEGCEQEKAITDIDGHLLCDDCTKDIVRCSFCNKFLAIDIDELENDNFGRLSVPELALPDKQTHLIFCNLDCLDAYLKKYRQEHQEHDITLEAKYGNLQSESSADAKKRRIIYETNDIRVDKFDIEGGGIYLETTDDSRGWFLGDKTRKIYKSTIPHVGLLTNLLISVSPHLDGMNGIKVKVHNPNEVDRMLVSKNDDVGSSVEYAKFDGSTPLELSAEMGQHVCIESISNGNWIRVHVYPGKDMKN